MKTLLLLLAILVPRISQAQESIQGPRAQALFEALKMAGAQIEGSYNRYIQVQNLSCDYTLQGFIYSQCHFTDLKQNGESKHPVGDRAYALYQALTQLSELNPIFLKKLSCEHVDVIAGAFFYFCWVTF